MFISESAITREIFNSWSKRKQNAYLKEHPNSKFNPKRIQPGANAGKPASNAPKSGRPKTKIADKLNEVNDKFNSYKSEAHKKRLVESTINSVKSIVGRRINSSGMSTKQEQAALNNHVDRFIKQYAPGIHRSKIYKSVTGKGTASRPTRLDGGLKPLNRVERDVKIDNMQPKMKLSSGAQQKLAEAVKAHKRLRRQDRKDDVKNQVVEGLKKAFSSTGMNQHEVDMHVRKTLRDANAEHFLD